jgi:hypothetical protein
MNLEARYRTQDLIDLFRVLYSQGYTGLNLKLIIDLIERDLATVDKNIRPILLVDEGINK